MPSTSPLEGMDVVHRQYPVVEDRDFEFDAASIVALGLDYEEKDVPRPNGSQDSKEYLKIIHRNRGLAPRKEEPVYKSIGGTLLDTLFQRFGFLPPKFPETFRPRDLPTEYFEVEKDLANLLGLDKAETTKQVVLDKGLKDVLATFFGQAMTARSRGSIKMIKLWDQIPAADKLAL
ncbi:hypothetical protein B0H17DRAFT_1213781 [Mycena rosella]|uniref:Uncharacterized protein n=1 Tax=Mycena rosella TaxID=1033263 RepID=A0AAD7G1M4_MYCRO|nr:hypothetical protein B0H17DRAFT_1213781 [Mycena rosella]